MAMAHEKLTQVQTIVFTLYEGYDAGAQSLRWTQISSWQYIGKQVPAARLSRIRLSRIRLSRTPTSLDWQAIPYGVVEHGEGVADITRSDVKPWRVRRRQPQPLATQLSRHSLLSQVTCKFGSLEYDVQPIKDVGPYGETFISVPDILPVDPDTLNDGLDQQLNRQRIKDLVEAADVNLHLDPLIAPDNDENTVFNAERLFIMNSHMDVTVRPYLEP